MLEFNTGVAYCIINTVKKINLFSKNINTGNQSQNLIDSRPADCDDDSMILLYSNITPCSTKPTVACTAYMLYIILYYVVIHAGQWNRYVMNTQNRNSIILW